jgi:hypothetical protein
MIENPYFLCLLILFPLYIYFWNKRKFYFRHPYIKHLSNSSKAWFNWQYFVLAGSLLLVIAASNFVWKMKETQKVSLIHKYVLVNDGSGSMVNNTKENGIGRELTAILSGNEKLLSFLGNRKDGSKDLVGAIVFADDAFTVSYLCDDPEFVHKKLLRIDYRVPPMNQGTNIGAGIWSAIEMVLSQNKAIPQDDLDKLQVRFYGEGHQLKKDDFVDGIVAQKDKFTGTSIIFFTDGIFQNAAGNPRIMSTYKLINFCKDMGIRVYFISIFELDNLIAKYSRDTGGRGEVVLNYDKKRLEEIYEEIATSQAQEYIMKDVVVDRSFAQWFGIAGLGLVLFGVVLHNTKQLSFTEV